MMINFEECLKRGKVVLDNSVKNRWSKELEISEKFLEHAKKSLEFVGPEMATIATYNSIFHSLRCLLYVKGYNEKSHICLFVSVRELYEDDRELSEILNDAEPIKIRRNDLQYGGLSSTTDEARYFIGVAERLLNKAKEICET